MYLFLRLVHVAFHIEHGDFTEKCVCQFRNKTSDNNRILLLSTKLTILNNFAAVTSVTSVLLFVFCTRMGLAIDIFVDVIIVWLGFNFTTPWFYRFKCGHSMKFWFAISKTMAWSGSYKAMCCASCRKLENSHRRVKSTEAPPPDVLNDVVADAVNDQDTIRSTSVVSTETLPSDVGQSAASVTSMDSNRSYEETVCEPSATPERGLCVAFCCTSEATNLYRISRREWEMFPDEMKMT